MPQKYLMKLSVLTVEHQGDFFFKNMENKNRNKLITLMHPVSNSRFDAEGYKRPSARGS